MHMLIPDPDIRRTSRSPSNLQLADKLRDFILRATLHQRHKLRVGVYLLWDSSRVIYGYGSSDDYLGKVMETKREEEVYAFLGRDGGYFDVICVLVFDIGRDGKELYMDD